MSSENVGRSSEVISNQIMYKSVDQYAPKYKYLKLNMSNILGNTVAVTPTGTVQIQFKMPYNTVFNLAKSKLATVVPVPAQGAGNFSNLVADCWPFGNQLVTFETGNGLQLLNLSEPSKYTKIVTKFQTKFKDYICNDVSSLPHICNSTTAANPNPLGTAGTIPYIESDYFFTSSAANTANNVPLYYELSNFSNTILGLNKNLYFGQNDMYIKMTIGPVNNWCFLSTSATNPSTGAATLGTAIGSLQNVYLYLAVEQNPILIDNIVNEFNTKGMKVQIDYPFVTKTTVPQSTNQAIVIPFVPAQGKLLKRIYHTVWDSIESLNTALDCENSVANQKVTSYNTYLDSVKLQDDLVTAATATSATLLYEDDWRLMQPFARDSIVLNYAVFQKNWCHIDDFSNPDMDKDNTVVSSQNIRDGLPMSRGVQWQFLATTANVSLIHDNFAVFLREILISPNGVEFI